MPVKDDISRMLSVRRHSDHMIMQKQKEALFNSRISYLQALNTVYAYSATLVASFPGSSPASFPGSSPASFPGSFPASFPGSSPAFPFYVSGNEAGEEAGEEPGNEATTLVASTRYHMLVNILTNYHYCKQ